MRADTFKFALTFDDGPGPSTAGLLDVLRAAGVRATFFILGKNVKTPPWAGANSDHSMQLLVRALREGHELGNHTCTHPAPEEILNEDLMAEIYECDEIIKRARSLAGMESDRAIPFRLPYGLQLGKYKKSFEPVGKFKFLDPRFYVIASMGRTHVHWTSLTGDWELNKGEGDKLDAKMRAHAIEMQNKSMNAVYCLHDSSPDAEERSATIDGVRSFLHYSKEQAWQSFLVPQI